MSGRRHIGAAERRARLAAGQLLAPGARASSAEEVAGSLVALHGTDPSTVYLAVGARLTDPAKTVADVERALYTDRSLVRMHGMRHTVFVFPAGLTAVVHASTGLEVAARERASLVKQLEAGSEHDAAWLAEVEAGTLAALAARGEATAAQLSEDEPRLRTQLLYAPGKTYEAWQAVSTRVLRVLGMEGRVVRGRPRGSWTSSQFRWALAPAHAELSVAEAKSELLRHWLGSCGPATEADLKWWTGWKVTDVRRALAAIGAVEVGLDEGTGFVLPDDVEPVAGGGEPWAALLPALDPSAMGWQQRDWYLAPELRAPLFDRAGNIGPTVWWDGRIAGGWAQGKDGEVRWRLLADVGREAAAAVEERAAALQGWLGAARVTPRFRTPLEKELAAG
ncbi:winged helix DNA-binding domain-containing protein [Streptomyces antnestii]|uniref:Winged helix DNA-binding domain-containing protein n=1 Tax=Streptomyces antnestii TaxID=2494256 RepID=A0A3S3UHT3_9ACTN|nr:winged helix DNA-binding domain-containing protein [Streptomyces sp. San01]RVU26266.1 winged helix DNA-binding domain-containing protein [Streptomyces sp. San01]